MMDAEAFKPVDMGSTETWPENLIAKAPEKLAAALKERARLINLLYEADREHRSLITDSSIAAAVKKDQDALAVAMASGRTDPGDKHFHKLTDEVTKAKRKAVGFTLALAKQNEVVDELLKGELGDEFRNTLLEDRRNVMAEFQATAEKLKSLAESLDITDGQRDYVGAHVAYRRGEEFENAYGRHTVMKPMGNPRRNSRSTVNELPADFLIDTMVMVYSGGDPIQVSAIRGEADVNALNRVGGSIMGRGSISTVYPGVPAEPKVVRR